MRQLFNFGFVLGIATLLPLEVLGQPAISPPYNSSYSVQSFLNVPGVTTPYGAIAFLDNNTLLLAGGTDSANGAIYSIGVVRNGANHITGFTGSATLYRNAPFIEGGLAYGPGGVLFAATGLNNLLEYKPGGGPNPDRTIDLSPLGVSPHTGSLQFVPAGYGLPDPGGFRILSYSAGTFYTATLSSDGLGTYDVSNVTLRSTTGNGPEGLVYVPPGSPVFAPANHYALISEVNLNRLSAYQLDANGYPIAATQSTFATGIGGAGGSVYDPVSGDVLVAGFGNQLFEVGGFAAAVPEPTSVALLIFVTLGAGGYGCHRYLRRRKEMVS